MKKFAVWADAHRDLWLDCIRIYVGLALFARGLLLITNTSTGFFVDLLQRTGHPWLLTGVMLHYVMVAHFVGGALLAVGFLTRAAAIVQIPILAGAVFVVHRQDGLFAMGQSLELSALVLFLLATIAVAGAGKFSLDHVMFRSKRNAPAEALPAMPQP